MRGGKGSMIHRSTTSDISWLLITRRDKKQRSQPQQACSWW
jgi:hypothetical protein